jgi:1,4-dihydroxy-6-naphthoate synthase
MIIRLGHSPDSDDAFMFWGLATGQIETPLKFEHILEDIQTLNDWAKIGKLEVSAISVHAFAYVSDKYALLRHGGSFGDGYGPMLIARENIPLDKLTNYTIAIPGLLTSAYLALSLFHPGLKTVVMDFDEIMPAVKKGTVDIGLIIHEGQLTYKNEDLVTLVDLGKWWKEDTGGLPLPLGVNVVRKDLGEKVITEASRALRASIQTSLDNRQQALDYALSFARGMDRQIAAQFVGMYVNDLTCDMGERGLTAIKTFLTRATKAGLVPPVDIEAIE